MPSVNPLQRMFAEDHREMMRGFNQLLQALRSGRDQEAIALASKIDQVAGPHIEFEERFLYPVVRESHGDQYADRLYGEHDQVLQAIRTLKALDTVPGDIPVSIPLSPEQREQLVGQLQVGIEHATSCGTLLSRLKSLSDQKQSELIRQLEACRSSGRQWTQLDLGG
jgi:hypothetical protein